jgi:hemoglobin-like flavoprotein
MTPSQVKLVQESFQKVVPIADQAADIFYTKLFELDPTLKPMFKTDIAEQGKKLMTMIGTAVGGLNHLDKIVPAVQELGKRHVDYGVKPDHYNTVATALLYTLETGLGSAWTPEVKEAWIAVYVLLSQTMKDAADVAA